MTIHSVFIDFGGVIVRTEDKEPRRLQAEKLGLTSRDLEKIIFESESSQRASTGEITEDDHWQAVAESLAVTRAEVDKITAEFFSGDRADISLIDFLRSLRPERKVCLISNAWSGLRTFITRQKLDDVFDAMVISAEVGLIKPDPRIYRLALAKLGARPEESVFIDDVPANVAAARSAGMVGIEFAQPEKVLEELKQILNNHR
jgi:haloacid dehalogenase superfamily, subfamily IA, variant 3 with third motif having DD or ED/haloacid dehalogenase superfamily, subfamily IA, variant 1 with third motif having Dx(3-4)D or Dx(3-4)E